MKLEEVQQLTRRLQNAAPPKSEQEMNALMRAAGLEPGSFYQELEMSDRYVDTHRDISSANSSVSLHSHDFYEILYCENSCDAEYLLGGDRYRLQQGDILIIPPGVSHRPLLPARMSEPYQRLVIWVSRELMEQILQDADVSLQPSLLQPHLLRTAGTHWEFLGRMFLNGVRESEQRAPGWRTLVLGNTITLLTYLYRVTTDKGTAPLPAEKPQLLDQIMAYIEQHLAEKITLAEVAHQFWVSSSTISQLFHDKMGVSFYRCVTQRRLIAAKILILQGLPLEQVGRQIGFADHSTFYRAFKQEYGISPRQFRKLQEKPQL